jgi:hypothetical protein
MPKLNTTIDDIELKTNKIISTSTKPASEWTDAEYPSAKTLYNAYNNLLSLVHPVGSILTTATKTNPAETLGGTWELVDKDAKDVWMQIPTTAWTPQNAEINTYSSNLSYVTLSGHMAHFRLFLSTTADATDTELPLGTLDAEACGLVGIPYGILSDVAMSDGGACTICWKLTTDGVISIVDILNVDGTHLMPSGQTFYLNFTYLVKGSELLDDFCDKFHWKRVA